MLTPDFDIYAMRHITGLEVSPLGLSVFYDDGAVSRHLAADLREHSPEGHTTHPMTRETLLSPLGVNQGAKTGTASSDFSLFNQVNPVQGLPERSRMQPHLVAIGLPPSA